MIHMSDPVVENPITEASDTLAGFVPETESHKSEDTAVVTGVSPTGVADLAWSTDGPDYTRQWSTRDTEPVWQYDEPNAKGRHSRLLWCVALAAVLLTAVAVGWFGSVFYREESIPTAKPPTSSIPQPKAPTRVVNPPPPTQTTPPSAPPPTVPPTAPAADINPQTIALYRSLIARDGMHDGQSEADIATGARALCTDAAAGALAPPSQYVTPDPGAKLPPNYAETVVRDSIQAFCPQYAQ